MLSKKNIILFYVIAISVIIANCLFIIFDNNYIFGIIPICLFLGMLLFYPMDKIIIYSSFFIPFSIPLSFFGNFDVNLDLPSEPIFIVITILFVFKIIYSNYLDKKFIQHPITISIILFLVWRFITIFTSTMPLVSCKNFLMLIWFIIPFYFVFIEIAKNIKKTNTFFWTYIIAFSILIIYFIIIHSEEYFTIRYAYILQYPFFRDHTSYGATIAMFIPILIGFIFNSKTKIIKIISIILSIIFIVALVLSYTRAAWISIILALAFAIFLQFKINYKYVVALIIILIISFFAFKNLIFFKLEDNKQQSSDDLIKHISSVSNVATDVSNKERINRWSCAIRMFEEKPIFGWGPGTYQFQYAPFQMKSEKTPISTNSGIGGNAHSDYLGALAESGLIGFISYALLVLLIITYSIKIFNRLKAKSIKIFLTSITCSLITYILHGFLNNFLDKDKIAVPFWAMTAIIVAIDIYYKEEDNNTNEINNNIIQENK